MSFLTKLKKELTEEQYNSIVDTLGDDFDWDVVPRSRLNKVIKQRNELKEQLKSRPEPLDDDDDDDDDDDPPAEEGKAGTAGKKQKKKKALTEEDIESAKNAAVAAVKKEYAVKNKLKDAKAKDVDLTFGLIDMEKVSFDDKGNLTGLDDQVNDLTKNKDFLFETAPGGTGRDDSKKDPDGKLDQKLNSVFAGYGILPDDGE